jgi:hypothetical protein
MEYIEPTSFQFASDFTNVLDFAFSAGMIFGAVLTIFVIWTIELFNK